jgi:hypothetical protein
MLARLPKGKPPGGHVTSAVQTPTQVDAPGSLATTIRQRYTPDSMGTSPRLQECVAYQALSHGVRKGNIPDAGASLGAILTHENIRGCQSRTYGNTSTQHYVCQRYHANTQNSTAATWRLSLQGCRIELGRNEHDIIVTILAHFSFIASARCSNSFGLRPTRLEREQSQQSLHSLATLSSVATSSPGGAQRAPDRLHSEHCLLFTSFTHLIPPESRKSKRWPADREKKSHVRRRTQFLPQQLEKYGQARLGETTRLSTTGS